MNDLPYIVVAGPTAAGKTAAAAELARIIGGEIISADSMQIYKYMDIGTAKPNSAEMKVIPHYLIDELYPDEPYSAYEFQKRAEACASDIRSRGKYPIVCGGTGFYINALINRTEFAEMKACAEYRNELYALDKDTLHQMLTERDPSAASEIHPNNIKRVIRALEYFKQTGEPISSHNKTERSKTSENAKIALLTMDRQLLYNRINSRVDAMLEAGLEAETRGLLERGYDPSLTSMQGLGYKELIKYFNGEYGYAEAVEAVKAGTRHYAKRQLTWFSRQVSGKWFDAAAYKDSQALAESIYSWVTNDR
jgi:tRNA dimethylallyltransferase